MESEYRVPNSLKEVEEMIDFSAKIFIEKNPVMIHLNIKFDEFKSVLSLAKNQFYESVILSFRFNQKFDYESQKLLKLSQDYIQFRKLKHDMFVKMKEEFPKDLTDDNYIDLAVIAVENTNKGSGTNAIKDYFVFLKKLGIFYVYIECINPITLKCLLKIKNMINVKYPVIKEYNYQDKLPVSLVLADIKDIN